MKSKLLEVIWIVIFILNYECYGYDWPQFQSALNCTDFNPQRIISTQEVCNITQDIQIIWMFCISNYNISILN